VYAPDSGIDFLALFKRVKAGELMKITAAKQINMNESTRVKKVHVF